MSKKKTHISTTEEYKAKVAVMATADRVFREAIQRGMAKRKKRIEESKLASGSNGVDTKNDSTD